MNNTPINNFLKEYSANSPARFHMPGHKGLAELKNNTLSNDITEIPGADNLLCPNGIIKQSQELCAKYYGSSYAFYITQGSTTGILTMINALPRNIKILVERTCHKSVISALALSGHNHDFLYPKYNDTSNTFDPISIDDIDQALKNDHSIGALFLTRPNYLGQCFDIKSVSQLCEKYEIILMVDEAHGAHFNFFDNLPESSIKYADMVIQSAHKTLPTLTQGAILHVNFKSAKMPSIEHISHYLTIFHTTSPSYLILASIESGWQNAKNADWNKHYERINSFINSLGAYNDIILQDNLNAKDFSRLVLDFYKIGITGIQAAEFLAKNNIIVEYSDQLRVICITSPNDLDLWYNMLGNAIKKIPIKNPIKPISYYNIPLQNEMLISQAVLHESAILTNLNDSIGKICACTVGAYPPGSALIVPGEVISKKVIDYIEKLDANGSDLFGLPIQTVK